MKLITICGNLGANAVARTTSDGRQLMSFNVAVNQPNTEPVWFNCVGAMREKLFPYLVKGQCVVVSGELSAGIYQNRLDLGISLDRTELCGSAPKETAPATDTPPATPAPVKELY